MNTLFAYGTLQLPEITQRVIGRALQGEPATLFDYRVGLVARANFPGIVPSGGARVVGSVLHGISQAELVALDRYEGELYRRIQVPVVLGDASGMEDASSTNEATITQAWVYVIAAWAKARVTDTPWTIEWYRQQGAKGRLTYRT